MNRGSISISTNNGTANTTNSIEQYYSSTNSRDNRSDTCKAAGDGRQSTRSMYSTPHYSRRLVVSAATALQAAMAAA